MTTKRKVGRPKGTGDKYTPAIRKKLLTAMKRYITTTSIPILSEFAYKNNVLRENLYQWPEFSYSIKMLIEKKESQLEKLALVGAIDKSMAIFSLKQLGWRDTKEITSKVHVRNDQKKEYSKLTPEEILDEINSEIENTAKNE